MIIISPIVISLRDTVIISFGHIPRSEWFGTSTGATLTQRVTFASIWGLNQ